MKIILSGDVLDDPKVAVWDLHELLVFACHGRHVLSFDPPTAMARCLETFSPQSRAGYERAIGLTARTAATLPANVATVRVEVTASPRWEDPVAVLPLEDALAMLREPLGILLENAKNDWSFLLGVMGQQERKLMMHAVRAGWAAPLHGGGSDLPVQLRARLQSPQKRLRTFVVFDSDRRHPDELDPAWKPKRPEQCQGYETETVTRANLPSRYWMLQRRFIESYMPEAELRKEASKIASSEAVEAFHRMSRMERWYFNMKEGFQKDDNPGNKHRCRDLYKNVDAADRTALHKGFGKELANHYALERSEELDWDPEARGEASKALRDLMRLL